MWFAFLRRLGTSGSPSDAPASRLPAGAGPAFRRPADAALPPDVTVLPLAPPAASPRHAAPIAKPRTSSPGPHPHDAVAARRPTDAAPPSVGAGVAFLMPAPAIAVEAPGIDPAGAAACVDPRVLDRRFTARLLALPALREGEPDADQRAVLQRLEAMAASTPDRHLVPRMPALLPRLLRLVRREDVSARELAEPFARDPALLGEVIRLANSPRYRTTRAISSVHEAILLLGQRGIEQLVVRLVMGPVFDARQGRHGRAAGSFLWEQAERCAHAGAWLRRAAHDAFEAYLAGMAAPSGLMVALRVLDRHGGPSVPDTLAFHDALLDVTTRLSAGIARQWHFPERVVAALAARARTALPSATDELSMALRTADRLSKRHLLDPSMAEGEAAGTPAEEGCTGELRRAFGG